jgi:ubiquinone biosynthesis protein
VTASSTTLIDDTSFGAFTDVGPWNIDLDTITWSANLDQLRDETRAKVPELTRKRLLPPGRRVVSILGRFGWAIGRWKFAKARGLKGPASKQELSLRLRLASESLGTTYIKLAQIISSGEGVFPQELVTEFRKCRDQVPAEPFSVVKQIVEEELGRRLHEVFYSFDQTPLAAASIAQVHRAEIKIDGEPTEVVVKVQRPRIGEIVHADIAASAWLAPFLVGRIPVSALANPPALVEVFAQSIVEELDFRLEAGNMLDVARSLKSLGQDGYVVPRPHPSLVTKRVLVMERLDGFQFDDVERLKAENIDPHDIVRTGMIGFLEGAMVNGIFHGDLHGGNLFVRPDGKTALLDYGIVGRLTEPKRVAFLKLLMASTTNNIHAQVEAIRDLGALPHDVDIDDVIEQLGLDGSGVDPLKLDQTELVEEVNRLIKAMLGYGARMPRELMLFAKNMVFLEGAIATLTPELDLFAEITHIAMWFVKTHGNQLAADIGIKTDDFKVDLTAMKGQFGVDPAADEFTYRELQERRELIAKRFAGKE